MPPELYKQVNTQTGWKMTLELQKPITTATTTNTSHFSKLFVKFFRSTCNLFILFFEVPPNSSKPYNIIGCIKILYWTSKNRFVKLSQSLKNNNLSRNLFNNFFIWQSYLNSRSRKRPRYFIHSNSHKILLLRVTSKLIKENIISCE